MATLKIIQNTDVAYSETFSKDGSAINLTSYGDITLYIFNDINDELPIISEVGVVADAANGIVNFTIDILKTDKTKNYKAQYKLVDSAGEISRTEIFDVDFTQSFDPA